MSILDKQTPTNFQTNIVTDNTFPNSTSFVLNGIRNAHDGGKYEYQSEAGNSLSVSLPNGYLPIGTIYGNANEVYIFSTNNTNSEIGIFKQDKYTTVVNNDCLDFNIENHITGEFRIRNGCERIIYWCDGLNPDRYFNLDKPEDFKDAIGNWDCNKFRFNPLVQVPNINLVSVNDSGGNLTVGSYYFQLEVLDENQNVIYKTDISPQVVIVDDSLYGSYNQIDGALPSSFDLAIGGVPNTTKSITLEFTNLDVSFSYIRVNVIRQIAGTNVADAHAVGPLIPISSNNVIWTYNGLNPISGDFLIDYSETLINNIVYSSSLVMEQVQGRLLKANLKQSVKDYSEYQKITSKIETGWVVKKSPKTDINIVGNAKNSNTYWLGTGFQGDEVYAFGIRYLHKDGMWSPVFHIPGRAARTHDLVMLTVVDNSTANPLLSTQVWKSDVEHLLQSDFTTWVDGYVGSTIPRWKVFNTAQIIENTNTAEIFAKGIMSYYEGKNTYPNITTCDDELIWGEDFEENPITTATKIRHHKFPDRRFYPVIGEDNSMYIYGVEFKNVSYPSSDVISHQFVFGIRDESNKTVVDSGWMGRISNKTNISVDTFDNNFGLAVIGSMFWNQRLPEDRAVYGNYISGNVTFNKKIFNLSHIKSNMFHRIERNAPIPITEMLIDGASAINTLIYHHDEINRIPSKRTNNKLIRQVFVEPSAFISKTTSGFLDDIKSYDAFTPHNIVEVSYDLEEPSDLLGDLNEGEIDLLYVYKKVNTAPFENLFSISYRYINFNPSSATESYHYNGDTLTVQSFPSMFTTYAVPIFIMNAYNMFYEERQENFSLRHGGIDPLQTYYKLDGNYTYLFEKLGERVTTNTWRLRPRFLPEGYNYNIDYTKQTTEQYKPPLPFNYDFCSQCIGKYENRIVFSPKSFDEEDFDLYRINKINDYIDIPAHRGPITGLKYQNNQLLVHCTDTTFILQPNPQALATDVSTVYLTTGDFLSIPPIELIQTELGFAGMQHKQHQVDTPYGHVWLDQRRGAINLFNGQLQVLSGLGEDQWFRENTPSELQAAFYKTYSTNYTKLTTFNPKGIGVLLYYDPRFKRLLITKKDFKPINLVNNLLSTSDVKYNSATNQWLSLNNEQQEIEVQFTDTARFENTSWTRSFNLEEDNKGWVSFHSYRPIFAFGDDNHYYTQLTNAIYKHNHFNNYQNYFGTKYDFIVEWYSFDINTDQSYGIEYVGYTLAWDSTRKAWTYIDNVTFDKAMFYNSDQSSGLINLSLINHHVNPYGNMFFNNTSKSVIKTEENYNISDIYDISTASPVITKDWSTLQTYGSYIDLLPLNSNLNYNVSAYGLSNFLDKYVINRLFFKPANDYKKVIILAATKEYKSVR